MDPKAALDILIQVSRQVPLVAADHEKVLHAIAVLSKAIAPTPHTFEPVITAEA